jgi:NADH-quinone oxidoreductase subunit K
MTNESWLLFLRFDYFIILLLITGLYCIIVTKNLMRTLIGLEILTKAVTLLLIVAGYATGHVAQAQAFVITLIVIEVVVIAVAAGVVLSVFNRTGSIDAKNLRNLKG